MTKPKLLIRREKKEFIEDLGREVTLKKGKVYFVYDPSKEFHNQEGVMSTSELKKKDGSTVKSSRKDEFIILTADFLDKYKRISRTSQTIPLKDIGLIISNTGINKDSKIVDAGAGSGGLACYLANFCKEVTTYEISDENVEIVKKNIKYLGLKNIKLKHKNLFDGITEKNVDVITLDVPDPWNALKVVTKSLKVGGYVVSYSPQATQIMDFVNKLKEHKEFMHIKTVELLEREWTVRGKVVKPKGFEINHSGFLTFVRKIK